MRDLQVWAKSNLHPHYISYVFVDCRSFKTTFTFNTCATHVGHRVIQIEGSGHSLYKVVIGFLAKKVETKLHCSFQFSCSSKALEIAY